MSAGEVALLLGGGVAVPTGVHGDVELVTVGVGQRLERTTVLLRAGFAPRGIPTDQGDVSGHVGLLEVRRRAGDAGVQPFLGIGLGFVAGERASAENLALPVATLGGGLRICMGEECALAISPAVAAVPSALYGGPVFGAAAMMSTIDLVVCAP